MRSTYPQPVARSGSFLERLFGATFFDSWMGPSFLVCFVLGGGLIGNVLPPFIEGADAGALTHTVGGHELQLRLGALLMLACIGFAAPWTLALANGKAARSDGPRMEANRWLGVGMGALILTMAGSVWLLVAFDPSAYAHGVAGASAYLDRWGSPRTLTVVSWLAMIVVAASQGSSPATVMHGRVALVAFWATSLYVPAGVACWADAHTAPSALFAVLLMLIAGAYAGLCVYLTPPVLRGRSS